MLQGQGQFAVSDVINGVLQPVTPALAIYPAAYGPGPIMHDLYATQPTTPPYAGQTAGAMGPYTGAGGTDTANNTAAMAAAANPFSPRHSPLLWSVVALVVGLAGLRIVHWG